MKAYIIVMLVMHGIAIIAYISDLLTKSFPYNNEQKISVTVLAFFITMCMACWGITLLMGLK